MNNMINVLRSNGCARIILFQSAELFHWQPYGSVLVASIFFPAGSTHDLIVQYIYSPANEADFKAYQAAVSTYAQSCVDLSTPKGILTHVSTDDTVQDWDSLREALGYEWFHFLSVS